jgi:hypothetical protein
MIQYARLPLGARQGDRSIRDRLTFSWKILYALGILRDRMLFMEAKDILGEPTNRNGDAVHWNYGTGSRKAEHGVSGRIVLDGNRENIVFTNRKEWVPSASDEP